MSTLGELLAEHTVLPGDAVDHLHAVVGEWQLLADLSFADYLMWVRRDEDVPEPSPAAQRTDLNVEAVPVRHANSVVAVLTHQTALADLRTSSPLERAYLDCAGDLVHM